MKSSLLFRTKILVYHSTWMASWLSPELTTNPILSKSSFAMLVIAEVICKESQFAIGDLIICRIDNLVRHDLCGFPMPTILATTHEIYEDLKGICCPTSLQYLIFLFSCSRRSSNWKSKLIKTQGINLSEPGRAMS